MLKKTKTLALGLTLSALLPVQISYVLGGNRFLDAFVLLLAPAFCLYLFALFITPPEKNDGYRVALFLLAVFVGLSLLGSSRFAVAVIDDHYHRPKILASCFGNHFYGKWLAMLFLSEHNMFFLFMDFVETVWGLCWRLTRWDFVIVLLQALPIVVLWKGVFDFFKREGVHYAGPLALAVILSLQVLWCQQASGFIDGTVGIFCGLALLNTYSILKHEDFRPSFLMITGLALVSVLCVISKPHLMLVGLLGIATAFRSADKHLGAVGRMTVWLVAAVGAMYFVFYCLNMGVVTGTSYADHVSKLNAANNGWNGMESQYFQCHPAFHRLHAAHIDLRSVYMAVGWFFDYKYRPWITPDPEVGGNGLLWTYVVVPVLCVFVWRSIRHLKSTVRRFKRPHWLIAALLLCYWLFSDGSIVNRFSLGFDIFMMSWAFVYLRKRVLVFLDRQMGREWAWGLLVALFLAVSLGNYLIAIRGDILPKKTENNTLSAAYHKISWIYTPFPGI